MADPAALEQAAVAAQRAVRGHMARKQVQTVKLYAEYEAQMVEMEAQQRVQRDEGIRLVQADNLRKNSEKQLLLEKSTSFVEKYEESEAARRLNILTTTLMKSKKWLRRLRLRLAKAVAKRKVDEARRVAEEERRKQEAAHAEKERIAAKARKRQEELAALEANFLAHQKEREAKAQESVRVVEQHVSDMDRLHAELALSSTTSAAGAKQGAPSDDDAAGTETKTNRQSPSRSSSRRGSTKDAAAAESPSSSSLSGGLPSVAGSRGTSPSASGTRVSWNAAASSAQAASAGGEDVDAAAELAVMTSQALLSLQEALQTKRHKVIKKMTSKLKTKDKKASDMAKLRTNLIQINGMIAKVKSELSQR